MKKLSAILMVLLLTGSTTVYAQSGRNCFNTQFDNDATTLNMRNAYLLSYLCTMSYVDYLRFMYSPVPSATSSLMKQIRDDDDKFIEEFEAKLSYFFTPAPTVNTSNLTINDKLVTNP